MNIKIGMVWYKNIPTKVFRSIEFRVFKLVKSNIAWLTEYLTKNGFWKRSF